MVTAEKHCALVPPEEVAEADRENYRTRGGD